MPSSTIPITLTHLGSFNAGYHLSNNKLDPSKPTLVCINSMFMTTALFTPQFEDKAVSSALNILAIEPLSHGSTTLPPKASHYTYWDSAAMALEVMTALGVEKAFVLGTSQGGWIVVRMALLAPSRVLGLLPLGTSMDAETQETREKGCWNPFPILQPFAAKWTSATATPDFDLDDEWVDMVAAFGFGAHATEEKTKFWTEVLKETYAGDEGRRKARMAVLCLLSRDSLMPRIGDVECPVHWLQGSDDGPYGCRVQHEQIEAFAASKEKKLSIVKGGAHYLNATNPKETNEAILEMVRKYA